MKNSIYRIKETLIHEIIHIFQENDTSKDVWLIITEIDQRKEKRKEKSISCFTTQILVRLAKPSQKQSIQVR